MRPLLAFLSPSLWLQRPLQKHPGSCHVNNLELFLELTLRQYYFQPNSCSVLVSVHLYLHLLLHLHLALPPNAQS